jgi:hypothetical protein
MAQHLVLICCRKILNSNKIMPGHILTQSETTVPGQQDCGFVALLSLCKNSFQNLKILHLEDKQPNQ